MDKQIRIEEADYKKAENLAKKQKRTIKAIISLAIEMFFKSTEKTKV